MVPWPMNGSAKNEASSRRFAVSITSHLPGCTEEIASEGVLAAPYLERTRTRGHGVLWPRGVGTPVILPPVVAREEAQAARQFRLLQCHEEHNVEERDADRVEHNNEDRDELETGILGGLLAIVAAGDGCALVVYLSLQGALLCTVCKTLFEMCAVLEVLLPKPTCRSQKSLHADRSGRCQTPRN